MTEIPSALTPFTLDSFALEQATTLGSSKSRRQSISREVRQDLQIDIILVIRICVAFRGFIAL